MGFARYRALLKRDPSCDGKAAPRHLTSRRALKARWIPTPIGPMLAVADAKQLHLLEFFNRRALPTELTRLCKRTRSAIDFGDAAPLAQITGELANYFAGRLAPFETPLAFHGSAFSRAVWDELVCVTPGTTVSYAELAQRLGPARAVRAVARANGFNQIAIVIPCHRLIGADGNLRGYGGKLWRKEWLLNHEWRFAVGAGSQRCRLAHRQV